MSLGGHRWGLLSGYPVILQHIWILFGCLFGFSSNVTHSFSSDHQDDMNYWVEQRSLTHLGLGGLRSNSKVSLEWRNPQFSQNCYCISIFQVLLSANIVFKKRYLSRWWQCLRTQQWRVSDTARIGTDLNNTHDDVIKWKHFPRFWPFVRGIHRSRWIPRTKASDAELWCFLWSVSE